MKNSLRIEINRGGWRADFSWLPALGRIIKTKFKIQQDISIALVGPEQIRKLNRTYRGQDKVTDVLSFKINRDGLLGEVVICPGQARRQALAQSVSYRSELQLLTVHGILHLLGYDHERSTAAARRQSQLEKQILTKLS